MTANGGRGGVNSGGAPAGGTASGGNAANTTGNAGVNGNVVGGAGSQHARRDLAEDAVLTPIRRELLAPEAVELACRIIRDAAKAELLRSVEGEEPAQVADIAAQIAELENVIASRDALAATLRPVVAGLREKMATVRRTNWRKAHAVKIAELPVEEAYRAAVTDLAAVLEGTNVEAARAAVRSLTGDIPVFEKDGKLYGRLTVDAAPLFRQRNPGIIEQVGSGGRIPSLLATIPRQRRVASKQGR